MGRPPSQVGMLTQQVENLARRIDDNTKHINDAIVTREESMQRLIDSEIKRNAELRQHQDGTIAEIKALWRGLSVDLYGDADSPGLIPRFVIVEKHISEMYSGQREHHQKQLEQNRRFWRTVLSSVLAGTVMLVMTSCYGNVILPTIEALKGTPTPEVDTITPPNNTMMATPTPTPLPADTETPGASLTPTSSIIEVTPLGGIVWMGDINAEPPPPGVWDFTRRGQYTTYDDWRVRACPDMSCGVVGSLQFGQTVNTVGAALDIAGATWLCAGQKPNIDYGEDDHGAQWCDKSFLAREPDGQWHGNYVTLPDPTPSATPTAPIEQGSN